MLNQACDCAEHTYEFDLRLYFMATCSWTRTCKTGISMVGPNQEEEMPERNEGRMKRIPHILYAI